MAVSSVRMVAFALGVAVLLSGTAALQHGQEHRSLHRDGAVAMQISASGEVSEEQWPSLQDVKDFAGKAVDAVKNAIGLGKKDETAVAPAANASDDANGTALTKNEANTSNLSASVSGESKAGKADTAKADNAKAINGSVTTSNNSDSTKQTATQGEANASNLSATVSGESKAVKADNAKAINVSVTLSNTSDSTKQAVAKGESSAGNLTATASSESEAVQADDAKAENATSKDSNDTVAKAFQAEVANRNGSSALLVSVISYEIVTDIIALVQKDFREALGAAMQDSYLAVAEAVQEINGAKGGELALVDAGSPVGNLTEAAKEVPFSNKLEFLVAAGFAAMGESMKKEIRETLSAIVKNAVTLVAHAGRTDGNATGVPAKAQPPKAEQEKPTKKALSALQAPPADSMGVLVAFLVQRAVADTSKAVQEVIRDAFNYTMRHTLLVVARAVRDIEGKADSNATEDSEPVAAPFNGTGLLTNVSTPSDLLNYVIVKAGYEVRVGLLQEMQAGFMSVVQMSVDAVAKAVKAARASNGTGAVPVSQAFQAEVGAHGDGNALFVTLLGTRVLSDLIALVQADLHEALDLVMKDAYVTVAETVQQLKGGPSEKLALADVGSGHPFSNFSEAAKGIPQRDLLDRVVVAAFAPMGDNMKLEIRETLGAIVKDSVTTVAHARDSSKSATTGASTKAQPKKPEQEGQKPAQKVLSALQAPPADAQENLTAFVVRSVVSSVSSAVQEDVETALSATMVRAFFIAAKAVNEINGKADTNDAPSAGNASVAATGIAPTWNETRAMENMTSPAEILNYLGVKAFAQMKVGLLAEMQVNFANIVQLSVDVVAQAVKDLEASPEEAAQAKADGAAPQERSAAARSVALLAGVGLLPILASLLA